MFWCEILFVVKEQRPWRNILSDPIGANFFTEPSVRKSAEIQIVANCLLSTDFHISNEDFLVVMLGDLCNRMHGALQGDRLKLIFLYQNKLFHSFINYYFFLRRQYWNVRQRCGFNSR